MKAVLENSLTKEQANRLFSVIDLNRDGILQAKELHQVMSDDIKGMISLSRDVKKHHCRDVDKPSVKNHSQALKILFWHLSMILMLVSRISLFQIF